MAEQVMSPNMGQAAACPYGRSPSKRSGSLRAAPPGFIPPVGGRELFGPTDGHGQRNDSTVAR